METCRRHGFTLGHVLYVLFQIAHSIVLHRRRTSFSKEEWDFRIREPMHFGGPVNPRPYLDQNWLRSGGHTEVFAAVTYAMVTLPFMPTVEGDDFHYDNLMSRERFWHRASLIRNQWSQFLKHPLMLQTAALTESLRIPQKKVILENWRARQREAEPGTKNLQTALQGYTNNYVLANGGSSFGSVSERRSS